jgi:hypothetical protein
VDEPVDVNSCISALEIPLPPPVMATETAPPVLVAVTPAPVKSILVNAEVNVVPSSLTTIFSALSEFRLVKFASTST